MLPDRVSNPEPLTYESGALLIALRGPAFKVQTMFTHIYRPDEHAGLLKIYLKSLVTKFKFSTLVA